MSVQARRSVALVGANGAGKSTLLRLLCGLVPDWQGTITLDGTALPKGNPRAASRCGLALVPEGRLLFDSLSVEENLMIGRNGPWDLATVYGLFPALAERRRQRPATLSGGQQQMLAIGRALTSNPDILFCDEISLGLSPMVVSEVYAALAAVRAQGVSLVIVDQDVTRACAAADEVVVLGSIGSIRGALAAGLLLGLTQVVSARFDGNAGLLYVHLVVFITLVLRAISGRLIVAVLGATLIDSGSHFLLCEVLVIILLAQMWNLLAGFAGQISLGHQAFVGLGIYTLFFVAHQTAIPLWLVLAVVPLLVGLVAIPLGMVMFHLKHAYFAVGMWVVAEIRMQLAAKAQWLGGTRGMILRPGGEMLSGEPERPAFAIAAFGAVALVVALRVFLRTKPGLAMLALRENEAAAISAGVDVRRLHLILLCLTAAGTAAAGYSGGQY